MQRQTVRAIIASIVGVTLSCGCTLALSGCASDFVVDPTRPRPTRAVQDPAETNSATAEVRGGTAEAVPLVSVALPNKPSDAPQVRTIVDNVKDTINPPAATTIPAMPAGPATLPATTVHIDPIRGNGE